MNNGMRFVRVGLLLVALAAGLLVWSEAEASAAQAVEPYSQADAEAFAARARQMEAGLAFALPPLDEQTAHEAPYPLFGLRWIQFSEENDGPHYALFLPGAARDTGIEAVLGKDDLLLDGETLQQGQMLSLAPGEHLLVAKDGPDMGREWTFVVLYGSRIPCVFLETESGSLDAIQADLEKGYSEGGCVRVLGEDGSLAYNGSIETMRGRGNVNWIHPEKKPFQFKLSQSASLLGMPAARRWLLVNNVYDKSLLRNQAVFAIARTAGMPFVSESRQVDLYINGEYRGCYLLCEKIEVGSGRVAITDLDELNQRTFGELAQPPRLAEEPLGGGEYMRYAQLPEPLQGPAGGYLLEIELIGRFVSEGDCGFVSQRGQAVCIKSPSPATREQTAYIAQAYQRLEDRLCADGDGPAAGLPALDKLIDLHSFAQKYLVEEIVKNRDAGYTSEYLYAMPLSGGVRLFSGPVWDYDMALASEGNPEWGNIPEAMEPEGLWVSQREEESIWTMLYRQPEFRAAVQRAFYREFAPLLDRMLAEGWIRADARRLADSACMDAMRWQGGDYDPDTFPEEYLAEAEKIEAFLAARMAWLQGQWPRDVAA